MSASAIIRSSSLFGYESLAVQVECSLSNGLPSLSLVGLGNKAVEEAKERVRSAIVGSGLLFPRKKIILNLAPADLPKSGTSLDVAIALSVLLASKQIKEDLIANSWFVGELSLDGRIRSVQGILGHIATAKRYRYKRIFIPVGNTRQAMLASGIEVVTMASLSQLCQYLNGDITFQPLVTEDIDCHPDIHNGFDEILGLEQAKRAMTIAGAGRHNILLSGPPGTGKSMIAKALIGLLPPLDKSEIMSVTHLYSLVDNSFRVVTSRPYRSPHHTASHISLIGGGQIPKPGEISLAHCGVLFLDEILEFPRHTLETLRQPLEDRRIRISRAGGCATFPADFMLVATLNPCPCGFLGDQENSCHCSTNAITSYQRRLSGPLLDRFDLHTRVERQPHYWTDGPVETKTDSYRQSVARAWNAQKSRNRGHCFNSCLTLNDFHTSLQSGSWRAELEAAALKLHLSMRGFVRVLRVARTIADLDDSSEIKRPHVMEALSYRSRQFYADS